MRNPSHDLLVNHLYNSVLEQGSLQDFFSALTQTVHSESAHIRLLDLDSNEIFFFEHFNYNLDLFNEYRRYYVKLDFFYQYLRHIPLGGVIRSQDVISDRDLLKTELYNDYMRRLGRFNLSGMCFLRQGNRVAVLSTLRNKSAGAFTQAEMNMLEALTPHLTRAFTLQQRMQQLMHWQSVVDNSMAQLPQGLIFLDNRGQVIEMTDRAVTQLQGHTMLSLKGNCLVINNNELQASLDKLIHGLIAIYRGDHTLRHFEQALCIPANGKTETLQITVAPLSRHQPLSPCFDLQNCIGVLILNPIQPGPSPESLKARYGLSVAECRLVEKLVGGADIKAICQQLGISQNTARSQLKAVFRKTGTNRQAELIKLILTGDSNNPRIQKK